MIIRVFPQDIPKILRLRAYGWGLAVNGEFVTVTKVPRKPSDE